MEASSSGRGLLGTIGYGTETEGNDEIAGLGIGGKAVSVGGGMVLGTGAVVGYEDT